MQGISRRDVQAVFARVQEYLVQSPLGTRQISIVATILGFVLGKGRQSRHRVSFILRD